MSKEKNQQTLIKIIREGQHGIGYDVDNYNNFTLTDNEKLDCLFALAHVIEKLIVEYKVKKNLKA